MTDLKTHFRTLPKKQLAISRDMTELICIIANMFNLGYEVDGEYYETDDGYKCQPMILPDDEEE